MKKFISILILISILGINPIIAQDIKKTIVLFEHNKFNLNVEAKTVLDEFVRNMENTEFVNLKIEGHTNNLGSEDYNSTLSKRRAFSVSKYLSEKGIENKQIKVSFFGEKMPSFKNESGLNYLADRRVEINIENTKKGVIDFSSLFEIKAQLFNVKYYNSDVSIKGKQGTEITIPKFSLVNKKSKIVKGPIEITLKEFYKKSDIILADLHTMSNNNLLESGGMIYIAITSNNEEVNLTPGAEITIKFASKFVEDMETFIRASIPDGPDTWISQTEFNNTILVPEDESTNFESPIIEERATSNNTSIINTITAEDMAMYGYTNTNKAIKAIVNIDKMVLRSNELGWINCDRFYKNTERSDLKIEIDSTLKPVVRLVFKDINSVMPAIYDDNNQILFSYLPVGLNATLIAYSVEQNQLWFDSKDIVIGKDKIEKLWLNKITEANFKKQLQNLD